MIEYHQQLTFSLTDPLSYKNSTVQHRHVTTVKAEERQSVNKGKTDHIPTRNSQEGQSRSEFQAALMGLAPVILKRSIDERGSVSADLGCSL